MSRDQEEFAAFYEAARDDCLRTILAVTRDRPHAEELVAEAFARAWASWPRVRTHEAPRAWVVRTALNARVSHWRRHRREVPLDLSSDHHPAGPRAQAPIDTELLAALRILPERQRQVVALRIFLDLDTAHAAELLGIAPGTASAHLSRAMAHLRRTLVPTHGSDVLT